MNRIARFEALAERLVEGTFSRLFAGHLHPLEVATHLARAIEDYQATGPEGAALAPTHYWVYVHPQDFGSLVASRPTLAEDLVEHVAQLARDAGLVLSKPPAVVVEPQLTVPLHSVRVSACWQVPDGGEAGTTREMTDEEQATVQAAAESDRQEQPFLIVQGQHHVELASPVISVGRALDNDVILEDRRVSRHHAQLRRRYGRYILYDTGSSGGTTINGYGVQECVLQPGDVISFAGVEVIYGEASAMPPDGTATGGTRVLEADTSPQDQDEG